MSDNVSDKMSDNVSDKMSDKVNIAIVTPKSRKPPTSKLAGGLLLALVRQCSALRISSIYCSSSLRVFTPSLL